MTEAIVAHADAAGASIVRVLEGSVLTVADDAAGAASSRGAATAAL